MKEFNLKRAMDASPFISSITDETYDALFEYYINIDIDLNEINIDNDIINWITECSMTEFKEYYKSYDDVCALVIDEENDFISYFA